MCLVINAVNAEKFHIAMMLHYSLSGEVVARIEEIVEKLKDALAEVAVVEYVA